MEINDIQKFDSPDTVLEKPFEGQIKFDSSGAKKNLNGYLIVDAYLAKVGVVERFENGELKKEFVSEEELFKTDSIATLEGSPVTRNHPVENGKRVFVDTKNTQYHAIGMVIGTPEKSEEDGEIFLKAKLSITDNTAIDDILKGRLRQVSPGYIASEIKATGNYKGKEFNRIQKNRRYNHQAIVPEGRGGEKVRVKLDGVDDYFYIDDFKTDSENEKEKIVTMLIDGLDVDVKANEEKIVRKAIDDRDNKIKSLETQIQTDKAKFDSLNNELKTEKEKIAKFDSKDYIKEARKRIKLEDSVKLILGDSFKCDGLDDIELAKSALKKMKPDLDISNEKDDYIFARFDTALEMELQKYDSSRQNADNARNLLNNQSPQGQNKSKETQIVDDIVKSLAGV